MATRSNIGILRKNGDFEFVYCHFDGYILNNGALLLDNYLRLECVEELISKGSFSALAENVEDISYYECEDDKKQTMNINKYLKNIRNVSGFAEYVYIFNESNNTWYVINVFADLKKGVNLNSFNYLAKDLHTELIKTEEEKERSRLYEMSLKHSNKKHTI